MKENAYGLKWNRSIDPEKAELLCGKNFPILKEVPELTLTDQDTEPTQPNLLSDWFGDVSTPTHILIEGDNLYSLACLCYTHRGQVNIIYIDPPYNTGNRDFMYNDRWIDSEHKDRKSIWLSFMEKRLRLAKILLTDDGVMFISIDDNMLYELKLLCDNIFGPRNFVANFIVKTPNETSDANKTLNHNYLLVYSKLEGYKFNLMSKLQSARCTTGNLNQTMPILTFPAGIKVNNLDDGVYESPRHTGGNEDVELVEGILEVKNGKLKNNVKFKARWSNTNDLRKFFDKINKGSIEKIFNKFGKELVGLYLNGDRFQPIMDKIGFDTPYTIWTEFSGKGGSLLQSIVPGADFEYPKHTDLLKYIIKIGCHKNATVLDFFAGSGTTGHAVLDLNKEDGGSRQFILCTNNENNIMTDVCYPRIKKVMCGYKKPNGEKVEGLGGSLKFFKTDFVEWRNNIHELAYAVNTTCSGMLRVKENVYNELENNEYYEIYYQGEDTLIAIYKGDYSVYPDAEELVELKNIMNGLDCPNKTLYIFALDWNADIYVREEFKDWKNTTLKVMPMAMINEYKSLFNDEILKK